MLPLGAGWLGGALAVLSCGWGAAVAGPPQQDGRVFLEIQVSLTGKGSDPLRLAIGIRPATGDESGPIRLADDCGLASRDDPAG
jgi:hypothetical protein